MNAKVVTFKKPEDCNFLKPYNILVDEIEITAIMKRQGRPPMPFDQEKADKIQS